MYLSTISILFLFFISCVHSFPSGAADCFSPGGCMGGEFPNNGEWSLSINPTTYFPGQNISVNLTVLDGTLSGFLLYFEDADGFRHGQWVLSEGAQFKTGCSGETGSSLTHTRVLGVEMLNLEWTSPTLTPVDLKLNGIGVRRNPDGILRWSFLNSVDLSSVSGGTTGSVCVPSCTGIDCGDDGCGGSCGTCSTGQTCSNGVCVCTPQCTGRTCGDDGCGGSCGTCPTGQTCSNGVCVAVCTPSCTGRTCGDDGCGESCGTCSTGQTCSNGVCVCTPQCTGRTCGDDGCGGSCGTCSAGQFCTNGICDLCGNGICDSGLETKISCPMDCQICGDGTCDEIETNSNCPVDCRSQKVSQIININFAGIIPDSNCGCQK